MTRLSVLLIDSIPDHHQPYEAALRARGFDVRLAHTAAAAMALIRERMPDCILIDVRLTDHDGWELCRVFKRDLALRATPIVVLAQDLGDGNTAGQRSSCNAWLARPTMADDVARAVEQVLASGRSEPADGEPATLGVSACPACRSTRIRAGVVVGAVQYYCCLGCRLCWRVEVAGESIA